VSAKDMKSYWIDDTEDHLSEVGANAATRVVEGGTTLLLVRGMTLHNDVPICRVRRRSAFNQDVKAVLPRAGTDPEFIPYLLLGNKTRLLSIVDSAGHGTGRINSDTLLDLPVNVPPLGEQRAIACILGSLDDKIELNRRMNRTLEEMARAIFKSWFIDFDPVRAKARVRREHPKWTDDQVSRAACPKLKPEIARLFPDGFEDSVLGEIPKGWRVGSFGDVVKHLRNLENPLLSPDVLFRHFSIPAFDDGQSPKVECGDSIRSTKFQVPQNAILLSKLNPEVPRVWMVDVQTGDRAVCSTEFLVLSAVSPFTRSFVYCLALSPLFRQEIEGLVTGTSKSHQRAEVSSILKAAVILPPAPVVQAFAHMADSLLARTLECRRESRTLAALRDALLPKLISGELRIPDVERIAGRCA
jgi:type I restriction enzyme S subunit